MQEFYIFQQNMIWWPTLEGNNNKMSMMEYRSIGDKKFCMEVTMDKCPNG